MSIDEICRTVTTRSIRKIEVPRPLKNCANESYSKTSHLPLPLTIFPIESVEKLISLMDMVVNNLTQNENSKETDVDNISILTANIIYLCKHLRNFGPRLENSVYQGQLDRTFLAFREALIHGYLEYEARIHVLEIIELRNCQWNPRKDISEFVEVNDLKSQSRLSSLIPSDFTSNMSEEFIRRSSKRRDNLSKSGSKNAYKEDIIIRNSDSGKVMGIKGRRVHMIEQLSKTIISFQRVSPTAKDRLVQITGPSEEKVSYATKLIEDTIRNNSSPAKEICMSESDNSSDESLIDLQDYKYCNNEDLIKNTFTASMNLISPKRKAYSDLSEECYQYKHKVIVSNGYLTITGDDYTYVTVAKAVLDKYFSKLRNIDTLEENNNSTNNFLDDSPVKNEEDNFLQHISEEIKQNEFPTSLNTSLSDASVISSISNSHVIDAVSSVNYDSKLNEYLNMKEVEYSLSAMDIMPDLVGTDNTIVKFNDRKIYTKEFLLQQRKSEQSRRKPADWELILNRYPNIVKPSEEEIAI
ncbi:hypothetical protein PGB90_007783 [Kerria lacca]